MDHRLIRQNARYILKGNLLSLWIPIIIVELIALPFNILILYLTDEGSNLELILTIISSLLLMPLTIGTYDYFLKIVRNDQADIKVLFNYLNRFGTILLTIVISSMMIMAGSMLFIIPGIIISLMYSQYSYVIIDNPDYNAIKVLKQSRELMDGYKLDYLLFNLKFIGWILLTIFTFGLAGIYVIPYIIISQVKYYDNLVHLNKN